MTRDSNYQMFGGLFGRSAAALCAAVAATCLSLAAVAKPSDTLEADDARHLLNRTGFAASQHEIKSFTGLTRQQAVEKIIGSTQEVATLPPPKWVHAPIMPAIKYRDMTQEERQADQRLNQERAFDLREWWFREMLITATPFTEKMTLFWHNHFATSQQKVRHTGLMYQQHILLRKYALGNFATLLRQIARDPAMLIYLDNANSRKEQPNENFAREVMELFTLGEGQYSEQDIKQMARSFTGWSLDRDSGEFMFRRGIHDAGEKIIFGKKGNFDGNQALDLLLKRPETAQFISRKLWREFVSPEPDEKQVLVLADIYRESGYNTAKLMQAMLMSDAFYAEENRASLIKSPVEFVVGTLKLFEIYPPNLRPFVMTSAFLGQNVFSPPNVKGWPGGTNWINSASLLGRKQFIDRLFRNDSQMEATMTAMDEMADRSGTPPPPGRAQRQQRAAERLMTPLEMNLVRWAKPYENAGSRDAAFTGAAGMAKLLLAVSPSEMPISNDAANWARSLVSDPVYQLK